MIGVILAGGLSIRMGQDKALMRHASGETWLAHSIHLLQTMCETVWISGRQVAGYSCIADAQAHAGPAAAIAHCLTVLPSVAVVFIPVDLPQLTPDVLRDLLSAEFDAVHYCDHPLPLMVHNNSRIQQHMRQLDSANLSIRQLLQGLHVAVLPLASEHADALTNANRPEDLKNMLKK